ncbi:MAG: hypothetical protein A2401_00510 [Candidatus Staskawiczbacteria bacterium RIFOXYC1_FULL_38_18]|uniref:Uncharacterized protein n=1 Tax=Candidatus Staskawiczbacteria bacterium RIFOXYC1_FULL_38_18 TaxID=1802229 RepID=A0A1G2JAU4_9BACT|nr:MAG: hypothetical protein A2401_00510 [Candidatus Staskawiczbacteria bacterium RIFOXYC1_FULL_38_18]
MQILRVILTCGDFRFTKDFKVSFSTPTQGLRINTRMTETGGYVSSTVRQTEVYIDDDIVKVWCDADLRALCQLARNNMGWTINNPQNFSSDPSVMKMYRKLDSE